MITFTYIISFWGTYNLVAIQGAVNSSNRPNKSSSVSELQNWAKIKTLILFSFFEKSIFINYLRIFIQCVFYYSYPSFAPNSTLTFFSWPYFMSLLLLIISLV